MKTFIIFIFYLSIISIGFSQKVQISILSNFHLSEPNSFSGTNDIQVYPDENSFSNVKGNLGAGYSIGFEVNKYWLENMLIGLGFTSFQGNKTLNYHTNLNYQLIDIQSNATQLRINPNFKFLLPLKKITFFMQSGIVIPLKTNSYIHYFENYIDKDSLIEKTEKINYNFSFGFSQNIGFQKNISNHFKIKSHFGILLLNQTLKNKTITKFTFNNSNEIGNINLYDLETNYLYNLNDFSNNSMYNSNINQNKAKEELRKTHHFTSFELNLSLIYEF